MLYKINITSKLFLFVLFNKITSILHFIRCHWQTKKLICYPCLWHDPVRTFVLRITYPSLHLFILMQPSMGTLNSPASRFKDSTPSRRRILRYINFGISESFIFRLGESSPNNIWITVRFVVLLFSLFESESWPKKNKSVWWIFTQLYFRGGESWPNYFGKEVNWWWILT